MSWLEEVDASQYGGLDVTSLEVDQAFVNFTTDSPFSLYSLVDDCIKCPFSYWGQVNESLSLKVNTWSGTTWRLYYPTRSDPTVSFHDSEALLCQLRPKNYGEFGLYSISYMQGGCQTETLVQPVNVYLPLLLVLGCLVVLGVVGGLLSWVVSRAAERMDEEDEIEAATSKRRVVALDTFRGLSIVLMIFVNYGGGHYWFFEHSTWNGLQLADVIFPWFIWIMGVCVPISIGSQIRRGVKRRVILGSIFKRSVLLFILGLALNTKSGVPNLSTVRIMGVLQRFSLVYLLVGCIVTLFSFNLTFRDLRTKDRVLMACKDILLLLPQWLVVLALLALHIYVTYFMPLPNCPTGYLGPGGLDMDGSRSGCEGGAAGYLDRLVLGTKHLYQWPTSGSIYKSGPFDPEGLLGTLTSLFEVFLGVQAGFTLQCYQRWPGQVLTRWLSWGSVLGLVGAVLSQARQEGGWIPLNKNLWSLSFVCVTSCFAFLLLSLLYYVVDVKRLWSGAPLVFPGMNSTIMYVGHSVTGSMVPWHWAVGAMNTHLMLTCEAVWATALWVLISYWLFKIKFFLSL